MKLIAAKRGLLLTLAVIVVLGAALGAVCGVAAASTAYSADDRVIVIDAGHGGIDAGVRGINTKTKESDINLAIAKQLKGYFADAGFETVMTRTTNAGLYGAFTSGFKMRDMKRRREIIENCAADMVISVHQNFCPVPSRRGGQVFYDKNSESGKSLAECIQASLNAMENCVKQSTPLVGDYYMLKCTQSPSVIVECGFLSNGEDEKLLINGDYQRAIAYAIFKGAVMYYS